MKKIVISLCLIGLIFIGQSGVGETQKPPLQVAVYPLKQIGFEGALSAIITSAIQRELIKSEKLVVRDPESTQKALDEIGLSQSGHCSDDSCTVEAGKILKAQKLIMGTVEKVDENLYTVSLRVIDVQTAKTEYQVQDDCTCVNNKAIRDFAIDLVNKTILVYLETGKKPKVDSTSPPPETPPVTPTGPTPPVTTPAGTGALSISTNPPGAEIYLDGSMVGNTPKTLSGVSAGPHALTLVLLGYSTINEGIEVRANSSTPFARTLMQMMGSIDVKSTPTGALVYIDTKYIGQSPKSAPSVSVGKHKVEVKMPPDYADYSIDVQVEANATSSVNASLSGKPGKVLITSTPAGAEVYVDGRKVGATTYSGEVAAGSHTVKVSSSGYQSEENTLTVAPNKVATWDAILKKGPDVKSDMVSVPAGEFMMGCNASVDTECQADEKPYHKVYLDAYYIDKYEVTNDQYQACVQAGRCAAAHYDDGSCYTADASGNWNQGKVGNEFRGGSNPVVCIDWNEAKAFCDYAGKRLPTEAEWEKAARGTDGRKYPWGNSQITSGRYGNFADESARRKYSSWTWAISGYDDGYVYTAPVGSFPQGASSYGAMDMAGNVWEWTADWYDEKYYSRSPSSSPKGADSGSYRVLRGGSWSHDSGLLRASDRLWGDPSDRAGVNGFRCGRTY